MDFQNSSPNETKDANKGGEDIAIRVRNLSKIYQIYTSPTDMLIEALTHHSHHSTFDALRDISFDIPRGEILGILGRNGARKSNLLQIVTDATAATTGEIEVNSRMSQILELGTGFYPDHTRYRSITTKPISIQPPPLPANNGMADNGSIFADQYGKHKTSSYFSEIYHGSAEQLVWVFSKRLGSADVLVTDAALINDAGQPVSVVANGEPLRLLLRLTVNIAVEGVIAGFMLTASDGRKIASTDMALLRSDVLNRPYDAGETIDVIFDIDAELARGQYILGMGRAYHNGTQIDMVNDALMLEVLPTQDRYGLSGSSSPKDQLVQEQSLSRVLNMT